VARRAEMAIDHHLSVFSCHFSTSSSTVRAEMAIDHHLSVFSCHFSTPHPEAVR
jgi:hypothetical protein